MGAGHPSCKRGARQGAGAVRLPVQACHGQSAATCSPGVHSSFQRFYGHRRVYRHAASLIGPA
eukprot:6319696-Pyramimonas_sp.AAC.1